MNDLGLLRACTHSAPSKTPIRPLEPRPPGWCRPTPNTGYLKRLPRSFGSGKRRIFMSEQEKIMIASDIHGSAHWCEKLLEAFGREKPVKLLLLGDILYHGPRNELPEGYAPKEVFAMLNPLKERLLCVRGNCDSEVDQMVLEFPVLADYALLIFGRDGRSTPRTDTSRARPPRRPCARAIFCSTDTRTSPASESFRAESCTQTAVPLPCPKKIPPIPISFWKRKNAVEGSRQRRGNLQFI